MTSKVKVSWAGPGLRLIGDTANGSGIILDHVLSGEKRTENGPRPMELLLLGLAGCTAMDVISILQKKRQPFTDLRVEITAERAEEHPRVYTEIDLEYIVKGRGIDAGAVERSIELSETKYCSAMAMLRETAEITTSYRIEIEEEGE